MFPHMAAAPTTPLPDLPREDRRRLSLFFSCNEDLAALAAALIKEHPTPPPPTALPQSSTPTPDSQLPPQHSAPSTQHSTPPDLDEFTLQSWLSRPDIAAHIDYRRQEADHRTRQRAISALEDVCRRTKDLIEKRRAASTILRILAGAAPTRPSPPRATDRGLERPVSTARQRGLAPESPPAPSPHDSHDSHPDPGDDDAEDNTDDHSDDSALSTQSSALPLPCDWSRCTTPHTTLQLQSLSLPSTPDLDAARLAFFAGGDSAIRIITPNSSRLPHPITTPQRIIANVLDALQRDKHAGLITAFNHSGILDRSPDALTTFAAAFTADFPHISRSHDPIFRGDRQPSDHEFSCTCSLAYPNFQNHRFTIRCTLHRPTDGPLARCWLLTMKPDTS
jgi:hypothetical protein